MLKEYEKSVRVSSEAHKKLSKKATEAGVSKTVLLNWLIEKNIDDIEVKFCIKKKEEDSNCETK
jgi:predicted DNA-binding protein